MLKPYSPPPQPERKNTQGIIKQKTSAKLKNLFNIIFSLIKKINATRDYDEA